MDFCLGERATDNEDDALAIIAPDPLGGESGSVADNPVDTDLAAGGIEGHVRDGGNRSVPPILKFEIELLFW
jgi:hypothetical protein